MIEEKTIVDQIEITRDRSIQVRLAFLVLKDGVEIADPKFHRTVIPPGLDPERQLAAVNQHLQLMDKPQLPVSEIAFVKDVSGFVHTPEVISKHRADQQKRDNAEAALSAAATKNK